MMQILMILMLGSTHAKAATEVRVNEELSAYTKACLLTVTRNYESGSVQLHCNTESNEVVPIQENLKYVSSIMTGSGSDVIQELQIERTRVMKKLDSEGFRTRCETTKILAFDNEVPGSKFSKASYTNIATPVITEQICHFVR